MKSWRSTGLSQAADSLRQLGANVLSVDLFAPQDWATAVTRVEAIIQLAITFTDDAGAVEQKMFTALTQTLAAAKSKIRFINTGCVWLYGATGDNPADDSLAAGTPFHPIADFALAVNNGKALLASQQFSTAVIHPAMVYHQTMLDQMMITLYNKHKHLFQQVCSLLRI